MSAKDIQAGERTQETKCAITCADMDSDSFGNLLGYVFLSSEEARHFTASGPHNANVSLTDAQQQDIGLDLRFDNFVTIRKAA